MNRSTVGARLEAAGKVYGAYNKTGTGTMVGTFIFRGSHGTGPSGGAHRAVVPRRFRRCVLRDAVNRHQEGCRIPNRYQNVADSRATFVVRHGIDFGGYVPH
jgi:hypothetical protein